MLLLLLELEELVEDSEELISSLETEALSVPESEVSESELPASEELSSLESEEELADIERALMMVEATLSAAYLGFFPQVKNWRASSTA